MMGHMPYMHSSNTTNLTLLKTESQSPSYRATNAISRKFLTPESPPRNATRISSMAPTTLERMRGYILPGALIGASAACKCSRFPYAPISPMLFQSILDRLLQASTHAVQISSKPPSPHQFSSSRTSNPTGTEPSPNCGLQLVRRSQRKFRRPSIKSLLPLMALY
jgi:hypothetical protein